LINDFNTPGDDKQQYSAVSVSQRSLHAADLVQSSDEDDYEAIDIYA
jgi:hypothetical protein